MLDRLQGAIAFVGASGLAAGSGASTTELSESSFNQTLPQRAQRRVLLADAYKWDQPSLVRVAGWEEFTDLITDHRSKELPPKYLHLHLPSSGAETATRAA